MSLKYFEQNFHRIIQSLWEARLAHSAQCVRCTLANITPTVTVWYSIWFRVIGSFAFRFFLVYFCCFFLSTFWSFSLPHCFLCIFSIFGSLSFCVCRFHYHHRSSSCCTRLFVMCVRSSVGFNSCFVKPSSTLSKHKINYFIMTVLRFRCVKHHTAKRETEDARTIKVCERKRSQFSSYSSLSQSEFT